MTKLVAGLTKVIAGLIGAVILLVLLFAVISWATGHPEQTNALFDKFMQTGANLLGWIFDQINSHIPDQQ